MSVLPWQEGIWRKVSANARAGRLPHALLLRGSAGVGKQEFAEHLAGSLLCEADVDSGPCGNCRGCKLFVSGAHPDALVLAPLDGKRSISIDQVRELIDDISLTAQHAGNKVVSVFPADALTNPAVNTLLKTLEEPPGDSVFILVSHFYGLLPATVRSRCQTVDFALPPAADALRWLEEQGVDEAQVALDLAHGAPLLALRRFREGFTIAQCEEILVTLDDLTQGRLDPLQAAAQWGDLGLADVNTWLLSFTGAMVRQKCLPQPNSQTYAPVSDLIMRVSERIDLKDLFSLVDNALDVRFLQASQSPLNEQLSLEAIALNWSRVASKVEANS